VVVIVLTLTIGCLAFAQNPLPHVVDLKAADGTPLTATYFAAAKPGPGVLLLHQNTRRRKSWDSVGAQLAAAGIHTLTLDLRGFGESGTPMAKLTSADAGGAGWLGVLCSVDAARRHEKIKSLVLI
jgi:predicted alpha/beta hydrolase